jgi:hypothetical protein
MWESDSTDFRQAWNGRQTQRDSVRRRSGQHDSERRIVVSDNVYARKLNRLSKQLIDALAEADDSFNFDAANTAKVFREWRATLSGVPAAESRLNFWATSPSELTAKGTDFSNALSQLKDTLRANADKLNSRQNVQVEMILSMGANADGESGYVRSMFKLREAEELLSFLLRTMNETDELHRLIRPAVDGVLVAIKEILDDRDLQRIDGAAQLLSSIDESEFRSILEDPILAAGLRELLTPVLVNLHDTCADLKPIELTVVKKATQKSRWQDPPEVSLKRTPEDWDVRMEMEAAQAKLDSSVSTADPTPSGGIRKISPMEIQCLKSLRKLRAKSEKTRKTRDQIAKAIDEAYCNSNIANAIAALSKDGLVNTLKHRAPKGSPPGCFITKTGLAAIKKEESVTKG